MSTNQPVLLVVDDDPLNQIVISEFLDGFDYELVLANSGEEAWAKLQAEPDRFDAVLLDRMMPGIDGIEVLQRIKQDAQLKLLPVILQTASSMSEQVVEGLKAGAYYYLTKPFNADVLRVVVATALRDRAERIQGSEYAEYKQRALAHLDSAQFSFKTPADARHIAMLLASICPSRESANMGLMELMLNAIEHGNLGITYDEKSSLVAADDWHEEIEHRLTLPQYAQKSATASFRRDGKNLVFTIQDEGDGFDWTPYLEMSVERMMDNHGRGIAISRSMCFSHLEYRGTGNCVVATIVQE